MSLIFAARSSKKMLCAQQTASARILLFYYIYCLRAGISSSRHWFPAAERLRNLSFLMNEYSVPAAKLPHIICKRRWFLSATHAITKRRYWCFLFQETECAIAKWRHFEAANGCIVRLAYISMPPLSAGAVAGIYHREIRFDIDDIWWWC